MKRFAISLMSLVLAIAAWAENDYIQVDWSPLMTDNVGWNIYSGGLAFGMVDGISSDAKCKMASSFEFSWLTVAGVKYNNGKGQRLTMGLGIDWKNYKLDKSQRFTKTDNGVVVTSYPAGAEPKSSRIKVFALEVPIIFRQRVAKNFDVFAGEITNFNVRASLETIYTMNGEKEKESTHSGLHQNLVTFDVMAGLNYKKIGAYVRYSPCNVIKKDFGPKINTLSVGLVLGL